MKCQYCNSEWNSSVSVSACPFCGREFPVALRATDISGAIKRLVSEKGLEVLKSFTTVWFYVEASVLGREKEKSLFRIAASNGVLVKAYEIAMEENAEKRSELAEALIKYMTDKLFLSESSAAFMEDIILSGLEIELIGGGTTAVLYGDSEGEEHTASLCLVNILGAAEEEEINSYIIKRLSFLPENVLISAGDYHTAVLNCKGSVLSVGKNSSGQSNVTDLIDAVAVSAGYSHTVCLKRDGTVVATGKDKNGQCKVYDWKDIVAISAGGCHTVGLRRDGTVIAVGNNFRGQCEVSGWRDIVKISAGCNHTVGLKKDGTVVAVGLGKCGQCSVSGWRDIVEISAGGLHTVGLKRDGTVVAVGQNANSQCNVSDWSDIVEISAGGLHTVGLKRDGTVVAVGATGIRKNKRQCNVAKDDRWNGIVAVSAGRRHTVGLKYNGTVIAVGDNAYGQCNVFSMSDIKLRK